MLRARRAGVHGLKALILFPMNALANDQAGRLTELLTSREELAGINAALCTGQSGPQRTKVTADGLITDRAIIHDSAPDILLTNYKMLDQLLLRHEDQRLWQQSAISLQYLVLDEFHTYDGAQDTDVAMLLRRLGLALKSYWPQGAYADADRARLIPCATLTDELDRAAELLSDWVNQSASPETVAVLVRYSSQRDRIVAGLGERGVTVRAVERGTIKPGQPVVMTMHRAKGTECSKVLLFGINNASIPGTHPDDQYSGEVTSEALLRERSLLYVAAIRARDQLAISWSGSASDFLPNKQTTVTHDPSRSCRGHGRRRTGTNGNGRDCRSDGPYRRRAVEGSGRPNDYSGPSGPRRMLEPSHGRPHSSSWPPMTMVRSAGRWKTSVRFAAFAASQRNNHLRHLGSEGTSPAVSLSDERK